MAVIADYFLKRATGFADPYKTWWFVIGLNQGIVQSFIVAECRSAANSPSPQSRYRE
ncbi:MAG: hypothetical protein M3495_12710 [Pseudomonadota bacterium]|nr:hypothetical protein [Pseudomonadota bacterium]